jgi:hypothetical protein
VLNSSSRCVDTNKHPDVEVHMDRQEGDNVPLVAIRVRLNAGENDSESLLMAMLATQRHAAILCIASLRMSPAQHGQVSASHRHEAAIGDRLDGGVEKGGRRSVWIEVNYCEALLKLPVAIHDHGRVAVRGLDLVLDLVVVDVPLDRLDRRRAKVVGHHLSVSASGIQIQIRAVTHKHVLDLMQAWALNEVWIRRRGKGFSKVACLE